MKRLALNKPKRVFESSQMPKGVDLETLTCETIFLDAGGVLVWPNWGLIAKVLGRHGIHVTGSQLRTADPSVRREVDASSKLIGLTDQKRAWHYFELILKRVGVPLSAATDSALSILKTYHQAHNLWEYVPSFVRPTLRRLRKQGMRLVVVSNANGTLAKVFRRLRLDSLVDLIIDSTDVGAEKPDPRLFDIALGCSGASRETTVHVGDLYNIDVVGARGAGLMAVLVDEADLYCGTDCLRIKSVAELPRLLRRGFTQTKR